MKELINKLNKNTQIEIKNKLYVVKTKTWYSTEEDRETSYIKCELSNNKVLVIIPEDQLIYVGEIIENMEYQKIAEDEIRYDNIIFRKTGEGHQFITNIEFGGIEEVEGKCIFEDYEAENNIISLGILPDNGNIRADVYADILDIDDIIVR